jgi:hypothetical protein
MNNLICYPFRQHVGHQWLTPIILTTQEAKIRRIVVQSQPRQIVLETLSWKKPITKKDWWSGSRCRHWVQAPVLKRQKKKKKKIPYSLGRVLWTLLLLILFVWQDKRRQGKQSRDSGSTIVLRRSSILFGGAEACSACQRFTSCPPFCFF